MKLSLFSDAYDSVPDQVECEWPELVELLCRPHVPRGEDTKENKNRTPAFSPAVYPTGTKQKLAKYVECLHLFVLDVDAASEEAAQATLSLVEQLGLAAVVYSSWSHARKPWSFRVVVPLSRPVRASEWRAFWLRANSAFNSAGDFKCRNVDRIYFLPYAPSGTEASHFSYEIQGDPLDVDAVGDLPEPPEPPPLESQNELSLDRLKLYATTLRRSKLEYSVELGAILKQVCDGDSFAREGERDDTIFKISRKLGQKFADCSAESIAKHFATSLNQMAREGSDCPTVDDVAYKIRRAQQEFATLQIAETEKKEREVSSRIREAFKNGRDFPYTDEEMKSFPKDISQRWLLQKAKSFYLFFAGTYRGPYTDAEVQNAALRELAPARLELFTMGKDGQQVQKSSTQLVREYGTVVDDVVLDMCAQQTYYDEKKRTLVEAPCPIRDLTPTYHAEIARWLELLGGEKFEKLKTWLAAVTMLSRPCVALFMTGPKDVGKSLLAAGVARIYSDQPTPLQEAFGDFNDSLAKNPLCFADENLPKDHRGYSKNAELRHHIQAVSRPFKRKFHSNATLVGATRTIVAANNEDVLATTENLSSFDIDAIVDRYLHIQVGNEAAEYLKELEAKGIDVTTWVTENKIAEHVLWLVETHQWEPKGRFLIPIEDAGLQRSFATRTGSRAPVCQWLIGYLLEPGLFDKDGRSNLFVRIKDKKLLVNVQGLMRCWDHYVPNEKCPPVGFLSSAVVALSEDEDGNPAQRLPYYDAQGKERITYRVINIENLISWAEKMGFADRERVMECLKQDTEAKMANLRNKSEEKRTN